MVKKSGFINATKNEKNFLCAKNKQSIFLSIFGEYPLVKIIDFLIYSRDFDYPITDIAKNSDVNFLTLKKLWPKLVKENTVIKTRVLNGSELFRINENNLVVQKIIELNNDICMQNFKKEIIKEV